MASFSSIFTNEDIQYIHSLPEVTLAKNKLDLSSTGKISFTIELTDTIRAALHSRFGLNFSDNSTIPMRWIKGDTVPHIDTSPSKFENTFLVYLNDSPGEFLIGESSYSISENTGYMFQEGILHRTFNTGNTPRLLLGPMNELAQPVGASVTFYYDSEANALLGGSTGQLAQYGSYNIVEVSGFTHWRLASNSTGPSSKNVIYTVGNILDGNFSTDFYYLYPTAPCFLEGTTLLCLVDGVEKNVPIENLRKDTLVKTSLDGYKKVVAIGRGSIHNPGNDERTEGRLYKLSSSNYPQLKEDLFITGCHSILEFPITEKQKEDTIKHLGQLFVTDKKYRLMACVDERAKPWNSEGIYTIYHIALENIDETKNYGVYANGGLLVETCSIRTLLKRSNMILI